MLNLRHCWPAVSCLGYAGYPNYIAGVVGFLQPFSWGHVIARVCYCLSLLVLAKWFFLLPTLLSYSKYYGKYIGFHWFAV